MVLHLHADVLYESSVYTIAYNNIRLELLSPLSVWALCIYSSRRIDLRVGVEISLWTRVLAEHSHAELCSPKSNHSKQSTNQQQGMIIDFVIHHIIWLDMRSLAELTRAQTKLFAASKPCHQAPELLVGSAPAWHAGRAARESAAPLIDSSTTWGMILTHHLKVAPTMRHGASVYREDLVVGVSVCAIWLLVVFICRFMMFLFVVRVCAICFPNCRNCSWKQMPYLTKCPFLTT